MDHRIRKRDCKHILNVYNLLGLTNPLEWREVGNVGNIYILVDGKFLVVDWSVA